MFPLQIKTNSLLESAEKVSVNLFTADSKIIESITVLFAATPKYYIGKCTAFLASFPVTVPEEQEKIWIISKTETVLKMECNGVEVLNFRFSDSTGTDSDCAGDWSKDVKIVQFSFRDTASDEYQPQPRGMYDVMTHIYVEF